MERAGAETPQLDEASISDRKILLQLLGEATLKAAKAEFALDNLSKENLQLQKEIYDMKSEDMRCWNKPMEKVGHDSNNANKVSHVTQHAQKNIFGSQWKYHKSSEQKLSAAAKNIHSSCSEKWKSHVKTHTHSKTTIPGKPKHELKACKFCTELHIWGKKNCTAYGHKCKNCWKMNHSEKACTKKKKKRKLRISKSLPIWIGSNSERQAALDCRKLVDFQDSNKAETVGRSRSSPDIKERFITKESSNKPDAIEDKNDDYQRKVAKYSDVVKRTTTNNAEYKDRKEQVSEAFHKNENVTNVKRMQNNFYEIDKPHKLTMKIKNNECGFCREHGKLKCTRCKLMYYCCKDHQKADWKNHKSFCKLMERYGADACFRAMKMTEKEKLKMIQDWIEESKL